ncbi:MAG: ribosome recycling factor, partial [Pseudomonadota bacterium]
GMDQVKKMKSDGMSEDDQKYWSEVIQEATDAAIANIDAALATKQDEIMQV